MKLLLFILPTILIPAAVLAQQKQYEPNHKNPYGMLNPAAPAGTGDFDQLIGTCD